MKTAKKNRIKINNNGLPLKISGSEYLKPIQKYINRKDFANGM